MDTLNEREKQAEAKLIFSVALLSGEILLSSGAEIYRVEDTIGRILRLSGYQDADSFVTPTSILMTLRDPSADTLTTLRRVSARENNLARVAKVNTVARTLCGREITIEEAKDKLLDIQKHSGYAPWAQSLLLVVFPSFFYLFFGGINVYAGAACLVTGAWLALAQRWMERQSVVRFFRDMISAAGAAFLASFLTRSMSVEALSNLVIISSIMPLVPGVAITTAIRDVLHSDYQSGMARAAEAFIIATAIAVGVGAGLFVFRLIP